MCLPLAVRLLIDQERHEVMKDVVDPLRVGSRAQKIPLLSTGIFSKAVRPTPHPLMRIGSLTALLWRFAFAANSPFQIGESEQNE